MTDPYAPPQAPIEAAVDTLAPPSLWLRLAAWLIDSLIAIAVQVPFLVVRYHMTGLGWRDPVSVGWEIGGFVHGLVAFVLVNGWLLHRHGQTIGKALCGMRIVTVYYTRPGLWRIVGLRTLPFWLLTFDERLLVVVAIDYLMVFRKDRRCLHDVVAQTVVVSSRMTFSER